MANNTAVCSHLSFSMPLYQCIGRSSTSTDSRKNMIVTSSRAAPAQGHLKSLRLSQVPSPQPGRAIECNWYDRLMLSQLLIGIHQLMVVQLGVVYLSILISHYQLMSGYQCIPAPWSCIVCGSHPTVVHEVVHDHMAAKKVVRPWNRIKQVPCPPPQKR